MAKKGNKKINVRWKLPPELHSKIATYQSSHSISTMEVAATILLEKITEKIKPIDL